VIWVWHKALGLVPLLYPRGPAKPVVIDQIVVPFFPALFGNLGPASLAPLHEQPARPGVDRHVEQLRDGALPRRAPALDVRNRLPVYLPLSRIVVRRVRPDRPHIDRRCCRERFYARPDL